MLVLHDDGSTLFLFGVCVFCALWIDQPCFPYICSLHDYDPFS